MSIKEMIEMDEGESAVINIPGEDSAGEKTRSERDLIYVLSVALILFGVVLILISQLIPTGLAASLLQAFGSSMLPLGAIGLVLEYYIQDRLVKDQRVLQNALVNEVIKLRNDLYPEMIRVARKLGITRIYSNRLEWMRNEKMSLYNNADVVRSLAVTFYLDAPYSGEKTVEGLIGFIENDTRFRILLCNPEAPFVNKIYPQQSQDARPIVADTKKAIEKSLNWLHDAHAEAVKRGKGKAIKVRLYEMAPGCYMQIIDNDVYFQPYLYGSENWAPPLFKIEEENSQGQFRNHFESIWEEAIVVIE